MSYFKISRVMSVNSGETKLASDRRPTDFLNPWGVLIPTGSAAGTIFFDSGSILASELPVNVPVPGNIKKVTCTAEHIYILG